ncbi:uncharacterized protein [Pyxicephalus adspersus]|uniref:uncharacterized protein n=1 Tax=Pyxicephalus adspersus TaxID=30357 RepID=UPI003B5BFB58
MGKIFAFMILSVLVTTGYTTQCDTCWSIGSTKCCTKDEITCEGSKCMTMSEYCSVGDLRLNTVKKTCGIEQLCGACLSITTACNFQTRVSTECGSGNYSNENLNFKKLCPDPLPPNNLKCPSCYKNGTTDVCESNEEVLCGGAETECLEYRGILELSNTLILPLSLKACITQGGCDNGFAAIPGAKEHQRVLMKCTPAIPV